jgi:hypothetical protein
MATEIGTNIINDGLVFTVDAANVRSFRGVPTTNAISSADTMASWSWYYRTTAASTFTTEFGTTGYRFTNQPSWNGIVRNFNLGSAGNYTFSAWIRYNGGSSNNNGATVYVSNYGGGDTVVGVNKSLIGVWQRISHTVNVTSPSNVYFYLISYGGTDNGTGDPDYSSWEVTMPQIEAGSTLTPFVNGTRGTTVATGGGWEDLTGNGKHGELVNGPTYNSSNAGSIVFDGSNDYIALPSQNDAQTPLTGFGSFTGADTNAFTVELWLKTSQIAGSVVYNAPGLIARDNGDIYANLVLYNGYVYYVRYDNAWLSNLKSTTMVSDNTWRHVVYVNNTNETGAIYINGVNEITGTSSLSGTNYFSPDSIGRGYSGRYFQGNIASVRFYDRSLSAAEVLQNFNATRARFGV